LFGVARFCAALWSGTDKLPGGFRLGIENRNEAVTVDVDE